MPRSIGGVKSPRLILLDKRRSSVSSYSLLPFSSSINNDGFIRRSFSYQKLPHQLFKLSIFKLDGSSFDVQIERTATVAELKQAVEDVFALSPKEDQNNISWSHVWGHFCLCFEDHKLLNDKDYIQSFQIKDGDQLHFTRYLSINYNPIKRRSKVQDDACSKHTLSLSESHVLQENEENEENGEGDINGDSLEEMNEKTHPREDWDENVMGHPEFKFTHFLKGWLSYSRLWFVGKSRSHCKVLPSRFSGKFVRMGTKFTLTRL